MCCEETTRRKHGASKSIRWKQKVVDRCLRCVHLNSTDYREKLKNMLVIVTLNV